jgi:hypothetical protein
MAQYGKKAATKVKKAMHERKKGTLKSGKSGKKVKSRKQAIAIGLSEARRSGAKVPRKRTSKAKAKSAAKRKSTAKRKSAGTSKKK